MNTQTSTKTAVKTSPKASALIESVLPMYGTDFAIQLPNNADMIVDGDKIPSQMVMAILHFGLKKKLQNSVSTGMTDAQKAVAMKEQLKAFAGNHFTVKDMNSANKPAVATGKASKTLTLEERIQAKLIINVLNSVGDAQKEQLLKVPTITLIASLKAKDSGKYYKTQLTLATKQIKKEIEVEEAEVQTDIAQLTDIIGNI